MHRRLYNSLGKGIITFYLVYDEDWGLSSNPLTGFLLGLFYFILFYYYYFLWTDP